MINVDKILGQILNSGHGKSLASGLAIGGLAGALTGRTGQKVAGTALQLGGAAAVAGLAYKAYQQYQTNKQLPPGAPRTSPWEAVQNTVGDVVRSTVSTVTGAPQDVVEAPPQDTRFLPPPSDLQATEALSLKLIRAMIGAAKADGQIDDHESHRIFNHIEELGLSGEERSFLLSEISRPLTVQQVAASAACPEQAAEIYAVSLLAVNPKGIAERLYLSELARLMRMDPALVQTIHERAPVAA